VRFRDSLEALGRVSVALGTALNLRGNVSHRLANLDDEMTKGEEEFEREREAFLDAAESEVRSRRGSRARRILRGLLNRSKLSEPTRSQTR
jgi:hypothetical protein